MTGEGMSLVFALAGETRVDGHVLEQGDAAIADGSIKTEPGSGAVAYLATLSRA